MARRGRIDPLALPRGPRKCRPPVDTRALEGPHVRCTLVAPVCALISTQRRALRGPQHNALATGERTGAYRSPLPGTTDARAEYYGGRGGESARGTCRCPALRCGQHKGLLRGGCPPNCPGPERGSALTLFPAMHRVVNAVRPRRPSMGIGWSGKRPTREACPCRWGTRCG